MFNKLPGFNKTATSDDHELPTDLEEPRVDSISQHNGSLTPPNKRSSVLSRISGKALLGTPESPKLYAEKDGSLPHEMVPVLTLLGSHSNRIYIEGYFMILPELNNEGQPIPDRKWSEVFATLQGTILTMWDAAMLEHGKQETTFINIADSYMRSVETLGTDLQNVILLSSTMKNRYLLQFGTGKLYNEWTAALRLAAFERTSLQEAYTGALLSSKGSQLHGIRALLAETRLRSETWCDVRFGVGMPWRRVWAVITPNSALKEKKERKKRGTLGKVELFGDPRDQKKKKPLAVVHEVFDAFAVFPEKAVLVNVSSLLKMECFVEFDGDHEIRESALFIMPEQRPGIQGYETLIRFLIPIYDVFNLYGRPKRLNADKSDLNSLLFGMPTLPKSYYLDTIDVFMLATLPNSSSWSTKEWNNQIKELIARKMAMGFRGTGSIHSDRSSQSSLSHSTSQTSSLSVPKVPKERQRAVSDPYGVPKMFSNNSNDASQSSLEGTSTNSSSNKFAPAVPSPLQHSRPAPKAPTKSPMPVTPVTSVQTGPAAIPISGTNLANTMSASPSTETVATTVPLRMPSAMTGTILAGSTSTLQVPPSDGPRGPRAQPGAPISHQRVKSEGHSAQRGLLSPNLDEMAFSPEPLADSKRDSKMTVASNDSFASAMESSAPPHGQSSKSDLFDPTFRPTHQSYADYSEYMRQYLQNLFTKNGADGVDLQNGKVSDSADGIVAPYPAAYEQQQQQTQPQRPQQQLKAAASLVPPVMDKPHKVGGISAMESDDSDDDDDDNNNENVQTIGQVTPKEASKGRTQLLHTPVRTPEVSKPAFSVESAASSATPEISQSQSTTLAGPKIAAYPNAPGSPHHGMDGSPLSDQRRPSGPRPQPKSASPRATRKPVSQDKAGTSLAAGSSSYKDSGLSPGRASITQVQRQPSPQKETPVQQPVPTQLVQPAALAQVRNPYSSSGSPMAGAGAPVQQGAARIPTQGGQQPQGIPQGGVPQGGAYGKPQGQFNPAGPMPGYPGRAPGGPRQMQPLPVQPGQPVQPVQPQMQAQMRPAGQYNYNQPPMMRPANPGMNGPPYPGNHGPPFPGQNFSAGQQFPPQGQPYPGQGQFAPQGPYGPQGPGFMPQGQYPAQGPYAPAGQYAPQGPYPQQTKPPSSSAKTGPVLRPLNEVRAQQLRSTRSQAMNGNSYGI